MEESSFPVSVVKPELPPKPTQHQPDPDPHPATTQNTFQDPIDPLLASISDDTSGRWIHDVKRVISGRICAVIPSVFGEFVQLDPRDEGKVRKRSP
jgi:hypothetical protein